LKIGIKMVEVAVFALLIFFSGKKQSCTSSTQRWKKTPLS
jgi:hypothetical protein